MNGRYFARPALREHFQLRLVRVHPADAGPDHHADAVTVFALHIQAGIRHRLLRRDETEVRVAIIPARLLRIHVLRRIPVANLRADLAGKLARIEKRHPLHAAPTGDAGSTRTRPHRGRSRSRHQDQSRRRDARRRSFHGEQRSRISENKKAFCQKFPHRKPAERQNYLASYDLGLARFGFDVVDHLADRLQFFRIGLPGSRP